MAEFVQTMKNWRRMCDSMQGQKAACTKCPLGADLCKGPWQEEKMPPWELAERRINTWAAEHPEPVYPTWGEYIRSITGLDPVEVNGMRLALTRTIPADIAQKLGIEPKGETQ